ncbi:MAG: T9SS type A sorting domain-containing protein [Bacteroidia bacterium]
MKKIILFALLFSGIVAGLNNKLSAQTQVILSYAGDSSFISNDCIPYPASFFIYGSAYNYTATDSIELYVNFGDGDDTTFKTPLSGSPQSWFVGTADHTYTASGNYSVQYIATGPDANADTLVNYNEVTATDTCGNIQGDIYLDNNSNCVFDAGDSSHLYVYVLVTGLPAGINYYCMTDANGHYSIDVPPGNYDISILPAASFFPLTPACPSSGIINVNVIATGNVIADFAVTCPNGHDLTGYISITHGIFPTSPGRIHPYIINQSCTTVAGSVTFILDPLVNYVGVCDPNFAPTVNGDTLTWTFSTATSYMNWYYWYINYGCIEVIGDPSLQLGDSVCFTMIINPIAGDVNPANNTIVRCVPALVSLDPNAKYVSPRGMGAEGYVAQNTTFDYTLEFQNTGTAAARNIFLLDSLNSNLDLSTLVVTGSSHLMEPHILPGNVLKFNFPDIWLIDSTADESNSHGWVTFRVTAKQNLPNLTEISNTAGIYFDFNAPVMTNTTLNTILDPASVNEISTNDVSVFPNPASSSVEIKFSKESNATFTLTDLAGKVVFTGKSQGRSARIDVSTLPQGVYLLNVVTEEGTSTHKVMVQH